MPFQGKKSKVSGGPLGEEAELGEQVVGEGRHEGDTLLTGHVCPETEILAEG